MTSGLAQKFAFWGRCRTIIEPLDRHLVAMHDPIKQRSSSVRMLGIIAAGFFVVLFAAMLWYQAVIEIPAVNSLQKEVLYEDSVISILLHMSPATAQHANR